MKDSYDPLDWSKDSAAKGYEQYSSADYDSFAKNPTYRSEFYDDAAAEQGGYDNSYDQNYDQSYDNTYDTGYDQGYSDGYDNSYDQSYGEGYGDGYSQDYDDGYQQPDNSGYQTPTSDYNDPQMATGPVKYSQADYDRMAQNPSYRNDQNPYKMDEDEFHDMIRKQKKKEYIRDQIGNLTVAGSFGVKHSEAPDFGKDSLLYLLSLGFGAALAKVFSLPLWAYPVFAGGIGLLFAAIKAFVIDNEEKEDALKKCLAPGVVLGICVGFSVYMKSQGY